MVDFFVREVRAVVDGDLAIIRCARTSLSFSLSDTARQD